MKIIAFEVWNYHMWNIENTSEPQKKTYFCEKLCQIYVVLLGNGAKKAYQDENEKMSSVCPNKSYCMILVCCYVVARVLWVSAKKKKKLDWYIGMWNVPKNKKTSKQIPVMLWKLHMEVMCFFFRGNESIKTKKQAVQQQSSMMSLISKHAASCVSCCVQNSCSLILLTLWVTRCFFLRSENVIRCHLDVWTCVSGYCVEEEDQIFRKGGSSQTCVCTQSIFWNPGKCLSIQ